MSTTRTHATWRLRRNAIVSALALALAGAGTVVYSPAASAQQSAPGAQQFSIPAGSLREALDALATQGDVSVMYSPELVMGKNTKGVSGRYTPVEAMRRLLAGSGLVGDLVGGTTFVLKRAPASQTPAPAKPRTSNDAASVEEEVKNMPAIMVTGTKTLNMDIMRTEDDPQPYVVFDREQIERSGATSLEQFLQQRLTMNTSTMSNGGNGTLATSSQISLRGLSAAETLILIDGHRASSPSLATSGAGDLSQVDITGIPLAAIDRIEVLAATASGIYGGNATGGVINVIMRRDYTGAEIVSTYGNTFDTDTATRKIDLVVGHSFNEGRTSLLLTASYSDANDLLTGDRSLTERGRERIWNNDPTFFFPPFGRPPLGATPNIASLDGSNLVLDDGTPLNSPFTSIPHGYAGPTSDGSAALVSAAGEYNWDLANTAQSSGSGSGRKRALYTQPEVKFGSIVLRHQYDESLQLFADFSVSDAKNQFPTSGAASFYLVSAESPSNPFGQTIAVSVPLLGSRSVRTTRIERDRILIGFVKKLPERWQISADYTWDRTVTFSESPGFLTSNFSSSVESGEIDLLRDTNVYPIDVEPYLANSYSTSEFKSKMQDISVRASGPLGNLPGGAPTLSASVAYRDEFIPDSHVSFPSGVQYYPERSQSVTSAYLELNVPIFSSKNARRGLHELDFQVAVRRDEYVSKSGEVLFAPGDLPSSSLEATRSKNKFVSVDPTIGVRWRPLKSLTARASYGTGFLPPPLTRIVSSISDLPVSIGSDPLRGGTLAGPYTEIFGGNPGLRPELSESWSAGFILTPQSAPELRLSIDYTHIEKMDAIASHPEGRQGIIDDESVFPGRIIRGPNLPGDQPGWAGPIIVLDRSALNLARAELEAWDIQIDYKNIIGNNESLDLFFMGTWQPHYKVQSVPGQKVIENAGVSSANPLKFKANAGVIWNKSSWRAGWSISYFDSYVVSSFPSTVVWQGGGGKIPSQIYHDIFLNYDFSLVGDGWSFLDTAEMQFGVKNVFNKMPPIDVSNTALGMYSLFGDPRGSSWYVSMKMRF